MNQYNSYYLYQQFEKRGSQDWLPCYPNIFSVDGDGTMPLVMKKENDPDCGYTGDTEPIYRWYPLPITTDYICDECPVVQYRWENMNPSTDYYCDGTTKYYKQIRQYSYDSGTTWYDVTPPEYQRGSLYQTGSTDCGYVPPVIYRWDRTNDTMCYHNQADNYLTFVAVEDGTFSFRGTSSSTINNGSIEYSIDSGNTWNVLLRGENSPVVQTGHKIMWKSTLLKPVTNNLDPDSPVYGIGRFFSTGKYEVEGNVMSLYYGDYFRGVTSLSGKSYAFGSLFMSTSYLGMGNVTNIERVCLPATTLSDWCYNDMFACNPLTGGLPYLPATSLRMYCYAGMYSGCINLESVPSGYLPVTTLKQGCYHSMFYQCKSLTSVPRDLLPSTVVVDECYMQMFQGCTGLTTAPDLPAPTLDQECYRLMFNGCSSLNSITCLAGSSGSETGGDSSTWGWLSGVSETGTFTKSASVNNWIRGTSGIPTGWTVQDAT